MSDNNDELLKKLDEKHAPRIEAYRESERNVFEKNWPIAESELSKLQFQLATLTAENQRLRELVEKAKKALEKCRWTYSQVELNHARDEALAAIELAHLKKGEGK